MVIDLTLVWLCYFSRMLRNIVLYEFYSTFVYEIHCLIENRMEKIMKDRRNGPL
jgi:hypothetical protein